MITGDNIQTARAIALECGILTDPNVSEPIIIEGKMFRELSDLEREYAAEKISVMARSSPEDKLLLVQALRKRGHVVAVTGDGANDAPALREADIGLSMGIRGTEAAKESSDIVILDDKFASVVRVVRWGRSVHANIQKFIQFQLTVNIAALIINIVAAISSGNMPLNAVQLLWVNLIMDTLGALALATEPPTDHLMQKPPVGRREPLITNTMWRNLIIMILFQVSVLLTINFSGVSLLQLKNDYTAHAEKVKNTFIFNTFVLCQVFNEFNSRKPDEINIFKGISENRLFIFIIALTVIIQAIIVQFLGKFASTVSLSWQLWLVSIGLASFSWPLAIVGKLIPVPDRPFVDFFLLMVQKNTQMGTTTYDSMIGVLLFANMFVCITTDSDLLSHFHSLLSCSTPHRASRPRLSTAALVVPPPRLPALPALPRPVPPPCLPAAAAGSMCLPASSSRPCLPTPGPAPPRHRCPDSSRPGAPHHGPGAPPHRSAPVPLHPGWSLHPSTPSLALPVAAPWRHSLPFPACRRPPDVVSKPADCRSFYCRPSSRCGCRPSSRCFFAGVENLTVLGEVEVVARSLTTGIASTPACAPCVVVFILLHRGEDGGWWSGAKMCVCLKESDAMFLHTFRVDPRQGSGEGWSQGSGSSDSELGSSDPRWTQAQVDRWFTPEWKEMHNAGRERRALMPGLAHHQGSLSNEEYRAQWSQAHEGAECPEFVGWALAHKGKASEATNDSPSAYNNSSFYSRISVYTEVGKKVHGPEWDLAAHPLDGEAQLAEERRLRQESDARQLADMTNLLAYLQTMRAQIGGSLPLPPAMSHPVPTTPQNL
ncbi:hypothetical protein PR202_ga19698 [Eleusine coracana subsp. coracana]|uniref:P-type Ca(2+) transporter n=1 Tax=Eleusine coracana subsp. coracana TaxID=191504 RepID=A0AAV5CV86_ELECO|nr:hypothetical protein PR202_ga19698 [Eleusine coracana subsp. coracana]